MGFVEEWVNMLFNQGWSIIFQLLYIKSDLCVYTFSTITILMTVLYKHKCSVYRALNTG